ncbi:MAG TPA: hypothetical protein VK364_01225 [Hymenobacter sp.]|nr:hypothetical protein [Hymenobacter sp.]
MKPLFLLLSVGILAAACQKKEVEPVGAEDPDWIKLEVPSELSGDEAHAIVGDIDRTLLVSTYTHVYATSDRGKTWQKSPNFYGPMRGLVLRNDTIFALMVSGLNSLGEGIVSYADRYTPDYGQTWASTAGVYPYNEYRTMSQVIGRVEAASITYRTQENTRPIPNSTARRVLASSLLRIDGSRQTLLRLPIGHYLNGLHLDAQNRLYVAASGLRFDTSTGEAINPTVGRPGVVYISRRPLP